jgi:hypothetical protein
MSYNLPDGVTDADIDRHFGGENGKCTCGHSYDSHNDPDDLRDDPDALIDALVEIEEMSKNHCDSLFAYVEIENIVSKTLASCQEQGCGCRKYYETEPDDGSDYAYDSLRDKRGE